MHVVIVGAGEVGWYLAQRLGAEGHDVVVIEQNKAIASAISAQLDVQVVVGNATLPSTMKAARIDRADLLAGVTQNDEVNLIASLLAKEAGVRQTVVRIQTEELRDEAGARLREIMRADVVIDPDADTADEIMALTQASGADEVYQMSGGDLLVLGCTIGEGAAVAGSTLAEIGASFEPDWRFLFGALTRDGETVIPRGDQRLEAGDHVRVLTNRQSRNEILELLGASHQNAKRVMVLGGGAVGTRVAERLEADGADVVLVEHDIERARVLSEKLPRVTVVQGDIEDTDMLSEESITDKDLVIAATGDDAANVLACAFAATGRNTFTVAVIHRLSLLPLVRQFGIDAALSPRTASANAVLRHVRGGTASVATFLESDIEVDEIEIEANAEADGAVVAELHLPHSIVLGAVIRPGEAGRIVRGNTVLHAGDNVVVFARPDSLPALRKAFTCGADHR
jgi:trk system potassium uptake protein TrkA